MWLGIALCRRVNHLFSHASTRKTTEHTQVATVTGFKNSVIGVSVSPTRGMFATGSGDNLVCVWKYSDILPGDADGSNGGGGRSGGSGNGNGGSGGSNSSPPHGLGGGGGGGGGGGSPTTASDERRRSRSSSRSRSRSTSRSRSAMDTDEELSTRDPAAGVGGGAAAGQVTADHFPGSGSELPHQV